MTQYPLDASQTVPCQQVKPGLLQRGMHMPGPAVIAFTSQT